MPHPCMSRACSAPNAFCCALLFPDLAPRASSRSAIAIRTFTTSSSSPQNAAPEPASSTTDSTTEDAPPTPQNDVASAPRPRRREPSVVEDRQFDDIDPNSLERTLEAHRASNRASVVRKVKESPKSLWKRQFEEHASRRPWVKLPTKDSVAQNWPQDRWQKVRERVLASSRRGERKENGVEVQQFGSRGSKTRDDRSRRVRVHPRNRDQSSQAASLDYDGIYIAPFAEQLVPDGRLPWVQGLGKSPLTGADKLNAEIDSFVNFMAMTPAERIARDSTMAAVADFIRTYAPSHTVELFGSERTGLSLPVSDIDFRLMPNFGLFEGGSLPERAPRMRFRKQNTITLESLFPHFHRHPDFILVVMRHARYPLISLQHRLSGIDVQVVCANDTKISRGYMQRYMEMYPALRTVYLILKVTLDIRGLEDVFRGGLGSYSLFMMVAASFKMHPEIPADDAGAHLVAFLNFWADFDPYKFGVALEPQPELFEKRDGSHRLSKAIKERMKEDKIFRGQKNLGCIDVMQPFRLVMQDPADPTNDLGRKTFGIKHILATLARLRDDVKTRMQNDRKDTSSILAPLVGSSFGLFEGRRRKLVEYGQKLRAEREVAARVEMEKKDSGTTTEGGQVGETDPVEGGSKQL
ncbi:hypothetical protein BDY21DRAFT_344053 [Lineolata rhizophorae]|uniref:Poly(A) RNA polymerase mitochondrial-like central palm domain-containing protein n=1 Tax=Lineolata rhizophorae TaxID=578093 RepID=A0A6A6P127_9PEZI|nr:hypothetical protein BDY21DRAFT_344053 [Lineolata rhizophorae]